MRSNRKQEHLENYLACNSRNDTLFGDVEVFHSAIVERNFDDIDTSVDFFGRKISFPFMINAVTGGTDEANAINRDLAEIAKIVNIPMAVGSQKIALDDPEVSDSFKIVRKTNPDGIVIANLSANSTLSDAKSAVQMIDADVMELHLNLAQELVMPEGDKDFRGIMNNIGEIVEGLDVPVIVKEVGTGISGKIAEKLYDIGVRAIDIAGKGGSNFIEVEDMRNPGINADELYVWGIPTALCLIENVNLKKDDLFIISSGGIKTSTDILKSMVLGADMCAGSGEVINYLLRANYESALRYVKNLKEKFKILMMLVDCENVGELRNVEYKITGKLKELLC